MSDAVKTVAGVAATIGGSLGGQPWLTSIGINLTTAGISGMLNKDGKKEGPGFTNEWGGWTTVNNSTSAAPLPVIYGIARVAPRMVDNRVDRNSTYDKDVAWVGAICVGSENGGGIQSVDSVWFNGDLAISAPVFESEPSTSGVQSKFSGLLEYGCHAGTDAQTVDAELNSRFPTAWPVTSEGAGIACLANFMTFDSEAYAAGVPVVSVQVHGQIVYDSRVPQWAHSDNPALCILDYLTSKRYGAGALYSERDGGSVSEIDEASFEAAANYFDELISIPGATTQKRFRCNGILNTSRNHQSNLDQLCASCRSDLIYQGGKFRLVPRKTESAQTFELTEDNIIGEFAFTKGGAKDAGNVAAATFIDSGENYQIGEVVWPESNQTNTMLANDNAWEHRLALDLPFTKDLYMAQQLVMVYLRETRNDVTCTLRAKEEALKLQVGEVVKVTHSTPAWDEKLFRVMGLGIHADATVGVSLREYDPDTYSLDTLNTKDTLPGADPPDISFWNDFTWSMDITQNAQVAALFALTIEDPSLIVSTVKFQTKTGPGDFGGTWLDTWDSETGTAGTDPQLLRGEGIAFAAKHNVGLKVQVAYFDQTGAPQTRVDTWTADSDLIAEVTSIGVSYDADGTVNVHPITDEDSANTYITAAATGTPPDPTATGNDGTTSSRTGIIETSITTNIGDLVRVKAVGAATDGVLGPVFSKNFRRGDSAKQPPSFQQSETQTTSAGTLDLRISDPSIGITAVEFATRAGGLAWSGWVTTWDTSSGTAGTATSLRRAEAIGLAPKHNVGIKARITYADQNGASQYLEIPASWDSDLIAEITGAEISFTAANAVVVTVQADEDTVDMYVTAGATGVSPPTATGNDGTASGRTAVITTSQVVTPGQTAYVKVIGANAGSVLGPVKTAQKFRPADPASLVGVGVEGTVTGTSIAWETTWTNAGSTATGTNTLDIQYYLDDAMVDQDTAVAVSGSPYANTTTGVAPATGGFVKGVVILVGGSGSIQSYDTRRLALAY